MGMTYKRGEVFWIKYYVGCKPIRESAGRKNQKEAERFLKDREGRSDQIERVKALSRQLNRVVSYLFPNPRKGRFHSSRLRDFRKTWLPLARNQD